MSLVLVLFLYVTITLHYLSVLFLQMAFLSRDTQQDLHLSSNKTCMKARIHVNMYYEIFSFYREQHALKHCMQCSPCNDTDIIKKAQSLALFI